MRKLICGLFSLLLLAALAPGAAGEELDYSGLYDSLPESAQSDLNRTGMYPDGEMAFSAEDFFAAVGDTLSAQLSKPLEAVGFLTLMILLTGLLRSFELSETVSGLAGALSVTVYLVPILSGMISELSGVCDAVAVFLLSALPVYAGLFMAAGQTATGTAYGALTLTCANVISLVSRQLVVPALSLILGLGISSSFSHIRADRLAESFYKAVKWMLIVAVTLFSGILSVQSAVTGSADAMALKTARVIASSAIPIVGAALGDGITAVQQSVDVLRSGAGAFGILAAFFLFLPAAAGACIWCLVTQAEMIVCDFFGEEKIRGFLNCCLSVWKLMLAVLISLFVIAVVCAAVLIRTGA